MKFDRDTFTLTESDRLGRLPLILGVVGLALALLSYFEDSARFYHAWLTATVYWVSIALGGLFFTLLHHVSGASWSVVLRRMSENLARLLPWLILAFVPVLLGLHDLYHWSHEDVVAADPILKAKSAYLNFEFFSIRIVVYFLLWSIISIRLYRLSLKQDTGYDPKVQSSLKATSAVGMLIFAITTTFASFDWLMSLDPHWFSTIFGVYCFSGTFLGVQCVLVLLAVYLRSRGVMHDVITIEHYHDLGKFMLAFTIFWSYIGFSQYFLIWYGNIPEETVWYLARWEGSWKVISLILFLGHFALPFVVLLFQNLKRVPALLAIVAVWILAMHWVDMYWLVYPTFSESGALIGWQEFAPTLGIGGIFIWRFWRALAARPMVPIGDPDLKKSLEFINQ